MWENNEYRLCFREDSILDFERVMLSSGECSYLLPMVFVSGDSKHVAYYDCKGFVPLSRYRVDRTEDALFILERVLIILSSAIEYLITPAKIFLSTDTVFFNTETEYIDMGDQVIRNRTEFSAFLKKFPNLKKVDMFGTAIDQDFVEKLEAEFPDVDFGWNLQMMRYHLIRSDAEAYSTLHGKHPKHTSKSSPS